MKTTLGVGISVLSARTVANDMLGRDLQDAVL